ncbi:MAG: hypothetical protein JHD15_08550 [Phenylobacterium sp.]|uniref:hypothetical protein n=1 Tax=Phenylobacterium sp. TaxID=1871053 RepID=UPI001A251223|nr:hypothetical protein [Phenylobacterium sp.]MBJ7410399.1 hypothetical protein [Phenylobacterium sp.]
MTDIIVHELEDVLDRFVFEHPKPDAAALSAYVARYPQHADALVAFAATLAEQAAAAPEPPLTPEHEARLIDAALDQAARLRAQRRPAVAPSSLGQLAQHAGLSLAQMAEAVGVDGFVAAKLDKRLIRRESLPAAFLDRLADVLATSADAILGVLTGPPVASPRAAFVAIRSAALPSVETFADAIRASSLPDPAKARWLAEVE